MHLGDDPRPEQVPARVCIGQHDHVAQPRRQQRPNPDRLGRPADGVGEQVAVVVEGPVGLDQDNPMRPDQVVAEGLGLVQQPGRGRASVPDEVEHEVDPHLRFVLGQALHPGDLHR